MQAGRERGQATHLLREPRVGYRMPKGEKEDHGGHERRGRVGRRHRYPLAFLSLSRHTTSSWLR